MSNLSPAAQAMITASNCAGSRIVQLHIAYALRALAEYRTPHWDGTGPACHWHPTPQVRRELLNIANELETQ